MEANLFVCKICNRPYDLGLRQPIACIKCGKSLCAKCKERAENGNCPHCGTGIRNAPINQEVLRQMRLENQQMGNEENRANENINQENRDNNNRNAPRNEAKFPNLPAVGLATVMIPLATTGTILIAGLAGLIEPK